MYDVGTEAIDWLHAHATTYLYNTKTRLNIVLKHVFSHYRQDRNSGKTQQMFPSFNIYHYICTPFYTFYRFTTHLRL